MVIHAKKKVYQHVPERHAFEKRPQDLNSTSIRGWGHARTTVADPPALEDVQRPPLYAVGWGWNSEGRAGNITRDSVDVPLQVQKSITHNYVSAAAGQHHSLLLSREGIIYSLGDGTHGQLGYECEFDEQNRRHKQMIALRQARLKDEFTAGNDADNEQQPGAKSTAFHLPKESKVLMQSYPRPINPTGEYRKLNKSDLKFAQVAAGGLASFGREQCLEEGLAVRRGLNALRKRMYELKCMFNESSSVNVAWSVVRQEVFDVNRVAEGSVAVWGSGARGQLGLGKYILHRPFPTIIPRLRSVSITQISAGANHVLAISSDAYLFSWGSGTCGKLGHLDFEDKYEPMIVSFFLPFYVEDCAAGDNHSFVLVTSRKEPREDQQRRVVGFGRGAHGRLGMGTNKTSKEPQVVTRWPASIRAAKGLQFKKITCGGAHTVILAYKPVPISLASPWGYRTIVLSWGYGRNGQLGHGYTYDSFVPAKARTPKCEIFVEISAGRSWTLARTITGSLYAWGKGLRGQLGLGKDIRYCLTPTLVPCFASVVRLGSGYAHNMCVAVKKKYLSEEVSLQTTIRNAREGELFKEPVPLQLHEQDTDAIYQFSCCRRHLSERISRYQLRFQCATCKIVSICYLCSRRCHAGHDLSILPVKGPPTEEELVEKELQQQQKKKQKKRKGSINLDESVASVSKRYRTLLIGMNGSSRHSGRFKSSRKSNNNSNNNSIRSNNSPKKGGLNNSIRSLVKSHKPITSTTSATAALSSSVAKHQSGGHHHQQQQQQLRLHEDKIIPSKYAGLKPRCCQCGVFNACCQLLPTIPEINERSLTQLICVELIAARKIQKVARKYITEKLAARKMAVLRAVRRNAATANYEKNIIAPIFNKFTECWEVFREQREQEDMYIEDQLKKKFDNYYHLQGAVADMNAIMFGISKMLGRAGCLSPRAKHFRIVNSSIESKIAVIKATALQQQMALQRMRSNASSPSMLSGSNVARRSTKFAAAVSKAVEGAQGNSTNVSASGNRSQKLSSAVSAASRRSGSPIGGNSPTASPIPSRPQTVSLNTDALMLRPNSRSALGSRSPTPASASASARAATAAGATVIGNVTIPGPNTVAIVLPLPEPILLALGKALKTQRKEEHDTNSAVIRELLRKVATSTTAQFGNYNPANRSAFTSTTPTKMFSRVASSYANSSSSNSVNVTGLSAWEQQLIDQTDIATTIEAFPTYAFSWNSVRAQQVQLPFHRRIPHVLIAHLTRYLPRYDTKEARYSDIDVRNFLIRFIKDKRREAMRRRIADREEAEAAARKKKAEAALAALKAQKFAGKNAIKQLKSMMNPKAPKIAPPREAVVAALLEAKRQRKEEENEHYRKQYENEDAPYDMFDRRPKPRIYRRNSIAAPESMYQRVCELKDRIQFTCFMRRTNSLPADLNTFRRPEQPRASYLDGVKSSLALFYQRHRLLEELVDPAYAQMWADVDKYKMRHRKRRVLGYCWCNPRLPPELHQMILDGERRRTISEPERLSKQLFVMLEARNLFARLREHVQTKEKFVSRRRSFDLGELRDNEQQIDETLGYEFDQPFVLETIGQLKRDSTFMSARMAGQDQARDEMGGGSSDSDEEDNVAIGARGVGNGGRKTITMRDLAATRVDDSLIEQEQRKLQSKLLGRHNQSDDNMSMSSVSSATSVSTAGLGGGVTLSKSLKLRSNKFRQSSRAETPLMDPTSDSIAGSGGGSILATGRTNVSSNQRGTNANNNSKASTAAVSTKRGGAAGAKGKSKGKAVVVWQEHYTEVGQTYYYNTDTGVSSWSYPAASAEEEVQICSQYEDTDGNWYWYNTTTGETSWM